MGKVVGIALLLGGIAGYLYVWISNQKINLQRIEELIVFFQKSVFAMESEKVKMIPYFLEYHFRDEVLNEILDEIAKRLKTNTYPKGDEVWRDFWGERKQDLKIDEEIFQVILKAGSGFFGTRKEENICFLQKCINEFEILEIKRKEKDAQERKVWIPVGMLGGIMLTIMFI